MGHKVKQSLISSRIDFFYYAFRNILLVSLPILVISALVLSSFHSSAVTSGASVDNLTLSLPTSCTLSSVINSPHNTTMVSGLYEENIGKTTITTLCNDGNGYAIYASGISNGMVGNNTLISSVNNNHNISTGIYDPDNNNNPSSWSMKLDGVTIDSGSNGNNNNLYNNNSSTAPPTISPAYTSYNVIPNTWTRVAEKESGTTDMIKGSSFTTTYAVYTSPAQHAGTYTGQVAYLLVHGSGDDNPKLRFMQDVAEWKDTLQEEQSIQAIDIRDGKIYWVTKLKDGHIWMTQNLDLDLDPAKPLTSNDTDLTDHSLTGAYADDYSHDPSTGITTWTPEIKTIDFQNTTVTGWVNDNSNPYSASKTDSTETGHASLGNYYNWTAAIASNNSSTLTQNTLSDISKNPKNSICPKGWRLPTISNQSETIPGSTNEFARLNYLYNNNSTSTNQGITQSPIFLQKPGYINSNLVGLNTIGVYEVSTVYTLTGIFGIALEYERLNPDNYFNANYEGRRGGYSIRCITK